MIYKVKVVMKKKFESEIEVKAHSSEEAFAIADDRALKRDFEHGIDWEYHGDEEFEIGEVSPLAPYELLFRAFMT